LTDVFEADDTLEQAIQRRGGMGGDEFKNG